MFTAYRTGGAKSFQAYKAVFFLNISNFSIPFLNLLGWSFEVELKLEGWQCHSLVKNSLYWWGQILAAVDNALFILWKSKVMKFFNVGDFFEILSQKSAPVIYSHYNGHVEWLPVELCGLLFCLKCPPFEQVLKLKKWNWLCMTSSASWNNYLGQIYYVQQWERNNLCCEEVQLQSSMLNTIKK